MDGKSKTDCLFMFLFARTLFSYSEAWNLWERNFCLSSLQGERVMQACSSRVLYYSWHMVYMVFLYIIYLLHTKILFCRQQCRWCYSHFSRRKRRVTVSKTCARGSFLTTVTPSLAWLLLLEQFPIHDNICRGHQVGFSPVGIRGKSAKMRFIIYEK